MVASLLVACGGGGAQAPAQCGDVAASPSSAILCWDPVVVPSLIGYRVYAGNASGQFLQSVDVGNVITYTVTGLSSGTRHYFVVTAYGTSNVESGFSNEVYKDIP